jgi:hypothetical protein
MFRTINTMNIAKIKKNNKIYTMIKCNFGVSVMDALFCFKNLQIERQVIINEEKIN